MILVAVEGQALMSAFADATRVEYSNGRLYLYKGKRQVGMFREGLWRWAYVPAPNAPELQARIKVA